MQIRAILGAVLAAAVLVGQAAAAAPGEKGTVTGRVVDAHGKSIAGARVSVVGEDGAEASTDAKGEFRLELEPGEYRLQFEADGHATAAMREPVAVEAGKETKLKKRVSLPEADEGSVVRGSVFDAAGRAVSGARVTIERVAADDGRAIAPLEMATTSDEMGLFAFRLPKGGGRFRLTATHGKYAPATVTVEVTGGEIINAPPLKLHPGGD
jgi:hypothetical protein